MENLQREDRKKAQRGQQDPNFKAKINEVTRQFNIADEKVTLHRLQVNVKRHPKNRVYAQREEQCREMIQELERGVASNQEDTVSGSPTIQVWEPNGRASRPHKV